MPDSLTLNGTRKEWLYLLRGRKESPFAPRDHELLQTPGMKGARIVSTTFNLIRVDQPIGFTVKGEEHEQQLLDELKTWILTEEDVEIEFDNVPGKTYVGRVTGEISNYARPAPTLRQGTLTFLCLPYKIKPEKTENITSEVFTVKGTDETEPIFELGVLAPITFALVSNGDEYMMIGQPIDVSQTPEESETEVFYHGMESMVGWVSTDMVAEGYINGSMEFDSTGFSPVFDAPNPDVQEWHGPALKHSLSSAVQNFKADMGFRFFAENIGGNVGRIEMYGLDSNNNIVFRAFIEDKWIGQDHFGVQLELEGGAVTDYLTLPKTLKDVYGRMKVIREGNQWTLIMQHLRTGVGRIVEKEWRRTIESDQSTQEISQIQLSFQKFYDTNEEDMKVLLMRCYQLNDVQGVPYIAQAGDEIIFDHRDDNEHDPEIRINGELRNDLKDFGATPFKLKPGERTLTALPDGDVQGVVRYRPRDQ
ncbi:distal tail protein Dit [Halalkalibacillus sediminis]|uniref:distal tail protein Dit n=1 Tax=Halalkalibacillus sediminis TaxID=2018042 RepID=UPI00138FBCD6|nr:distal tail protein Dit [Halalkalibacillus sediminis]